MRVLVIAPSYYGYDVSIGESFERLGHDVALVSYFPHQRPAHKVANRIIDEVLPRVGVSGPARNREQRFNALVLARAAAQRPDTILVVKGDILYPDTVATLARKSPLVYWAYDDPYRYPNVVASLAEYRAVASFARTDTARLAQDGYDSHYVPLAFDDRVFGATRSRSVSSPPVSFVGARYPEREALLAQVAAITDLGVWGGDWKRRPWRRRFYEPRTALDRSFMGGADLADANAIYQQSDVNLNIHGQWDGLNMRVFEIPGAGGFQLCDSGRGIEEAFEPEKEIALYGSPEEMLDKARFYLANSRERVRIAEAGRIRARRDHTMVRRAAQLLKIIGAE